MQPEYVGVNTFLGAEMAEWTELTDDIDAVAFGAPFDGGSIHKPGSRYGPQGVRSASSKLESMFEYDVELFNTATKRTGSYGSLELRDCGDIPIAPHDLERTHEIVRDHVRTVPESTLPILIGGDHSLTYPTFQTYAEKVDGDVGLIHLDAHSDVWGSSPLYGEHNAGSVVADIAESEYGSYENVAMIGVRAHQDMDFVELVEEADMYVEYARDVHEKGIHDCVETAIHHACSDVDHAYLTIDIDVVDPAFAPGTGTPEPGGLTSADVLRAAERLGRCEEIGAVDLMEVAPTVDPGYSTSLLGAYVLSRFIQSHFYEELP